MNSKNLTLIDADSLCYIVGNCTTLSKAIDKVDERIDNIISNTKADYISLFISKGKYFRHDIFSEYKGNRKTKPPMWMRSIKSYLEEKYEANFMPKVEADDLVAYWMNQGIGYTPKDTEKSIDSWHMLKQAKKYLEEECNEEYLIEKINLTMSAIDKDLLNSIPGRHWNFTYKIKEESKLKSKDKLTDDDFDKGFWVETDEDNSNKFIWEQMVTGDTADGIAGLKGKGRAFVDKLFKDKITANLPFLILHEYMFHYQSISQGIYEFQKNYRLLHMLENDEDFMREVGRLPEFPNIIKVKNELPKTIAENLF